MKLLNRNFFTYSFLLIVILACGKKDSISESNPKIKEEQDSSFFDISNPKGLRVMTYNIRYGRGMDDKFDLNRIIKIIKEARPKIIVLNEVDRFFSDRSKFQNQVKMISDSLDMFYIYQGTTINPATSASMGNPREHGHAILSKFPFLQTEKRMFTKSGQYNRGIARAKVEVNDIELDVFATHWGLSEDMRAVHLKESVEFMNEFKGKKIFLGDLNAISEEHNIMALKSLFKDATPDNFYTFNAERPTSKIDYIFLDKSIQVNQATVLNTIASDHRPVVVDLDITSESENNILLYPDFPESFEIVNGNFIDYTSGNRMRRFPTGRWKFIQSGISEENLIYDDKPISGLYSVRMNQKLEESAFIEMDFDVTEGVSQVSVWYGSYFKDPSSVWQLEYSTDKGQTWSKVGERITDAGVLRKEAVFKLNIQEPVRFRINKLGIGQKNNGRLNIDNFSIFKK